MQIHLSHFLVFKFKNGDRIGIILISREKLTSGQKVSYIKLDNRIYYVKGNNL